MAGEQRTRIVPPRGKYDVFRLETPNRGVLILSRYDGARRPMLWVEPFPDAESPVIMLRGRRVLRALAMAILQELDA